MINIEHAIIEKRNLRLTANPIEPFLLAIPIELQLHIISFLDYPSSLALSHANKQLHSMIPVETPKTSTQKMAFLTAVETWQRNTARYACKYCLKLRPSHAFADNQLNGRRSKGDAECDRRVCLDCGFRKGIYQPGQPIVVNGRRQILCSLCNERRRYGMYCMLCWRCESCFAKHNMPRTPYHTSMGQYIRQHGCPRCSHHLEDLGGPESEAQMTFEEVLLHMKMAGLERHVEETVSFWYEDYR
ncbi:hypothetical protein N7532_001697 [Penicillium argentinense]|uniref:F-box domain-containing protein n=1 Tax=Penicillium argentinense TaxID=1131581 RepID=A0A9W9G346_9EURO|nr:uncharacterized protein N7532_001697 [Penicillium argentinense]KAJ5111162.1 hypothetical protein N7532_001697 [Penicillium argentinense]